MDNLKFFNANDAFYYLYNYINKQGQIIDNTKVIYNVGFYLNNPTDNIISHEFRRFNEEYAKYEFNWYLSGNKNATEISKKAKIWKNHMDEFGNVHSNYGYQWNRNNQLNQIIEKLKLNNNSRQAVITIYDGKEFDKYKYDTPCTLSIHFQIIEKKLCMTVNMRSNDIWFGFCNDQYCFSNLQLMVSEKLNLPIGWYYHFASNMHLYEKYYNKY